MPAGDPLAPALRAPDVTFLPVDAAALATVLRGPCADLGALVHALAAHELAGIESFDELLAPPAMRGIDTHRYQTETVRRVLRTLRGRALLADEVGLGKTVEALLVMREYQLRGLVKRTLVLVPAPLVGQWAGELSSKAMIPALTTDDPLARDDPERFWRSDGVIVASLPTARSARHAHLVQAIDWDLVVVDEAHRLKNRATVSHKLVDGIKSRFLLLLTATPVENDLEELYNLVTLLRPGQFATPAAFRRQFVDPKEPTSPRNRERLRALLGEVMVRNTRAACGLKLPPRLVTTVVVEPHPEERELYERTLALLRDNAADAGARRACATLLLEAGSSARAVAGTLDRMLAARGSEGWRASLPELSRKARAIASSRKADRLVELVRAHGTHVLVFSRFRDTLDHVASALAAAGLPHVVFHGGLDRAAKRDAVERFRGGACAMLATDVGGEGHNLHFCNVLVNFDLPYNPMQIEQRIGRLHRMGQTREVVVYNLCGRGTVEEQVLDVLDRRVNLFELVVGEMDMVLGNLADERDLEQRILDLYAEARSEADVARGLDDIAGELLAARGRYDRARALDDALFSEDYEAT